MTVRQVEILMAVVLALASLVLMYKSYNELSIGWIPDRGPGSGMWPFWLSTGMFLSCIWTIFRWFRGTTPESRSDEKFMSRSALRLISITMLALIALLGVTHVLGIYIAMFLFMIFYLRVMGGHGWLLTANLSLGIPVYLFLFFEGQLRKTLPKGMNFAEDAFVDLGFYDLLYGGADHWKFAHYLTFFVVGVNALTLAWVFGQWAMNYKARRANNGEEA